MYTIAIVVAVVLFVISSTIINDLSKLLHLRVVKPKNNVALPDQFPDSLKASMATYVEERLPVGVNLSHYECNTHLEGFIKEPDWVAVYYHAVEATYAEVRTHNNPLPGTPFRLNFVTLYDELRVSTVDISDEALGNEGGNVQVHKSSQAGPHGHWKQHLKQLYLLEKSKDVTSERLYFNLLEYTKRSQSDIAAYLSGIEAQGNLRKRENGYQLRWKSVKNMLFGNNLATATIKNFEEPRFETPALSSDEFTEVETIAYHKKRALEKNVYISFTFKFWAFIASGVTCSVFFGLLFSWASVLFIMPVLLLHELGHLLAMIAFGYKRKFMLFMPLGAFVTGEKEDATTWQEMVVYLAGPIPGIVLGLALLLLLPDMSHSTHFFVLTLLALNGFNLLPVMPLDGGQLVNLAISNRFPAAQFLLHCFSTVICALVALLLGDVLFWILAAWLAMGLPQAYRKIALIKQLTNTSNENTENEIVMQSFSKLDNTEKLFTNRYETVRFIVTNLWKSKPSIGKSSLAMMVYVAALLAPPWLLVNNYNSILPQFFADSPDDIAESQKEWVQYFLDEAETDEERVFVLIDAASEPSDPNVEPSLAYLDQALSLVENTENPEELRAYIYSSRYDVYMIYEQDLQANDVLQEMISMGQSSPAMLMEVANVYTGFAYDDYYTSEEKIDYLQQAKTVFESQGELYSATNALIIQAEVLAKSGDRDRAYELLKIYQTKPHNNESAELLHARSARLYTEDGLFNAAIQHTLKAQVLTDYSYSRHNYEEELGWLHALNGLSHMAARHFENARLDDVDRMGFDEIEDIGFLERVIVNTVFSEEKLWHPSNDAPPLVLAYLDNNRALARELYRDMEKRWRNSHHYENSKRELIDIFQPYQENVKHPGNFHNRKQRLIREAINYSS